MTFLSGKYFKLTFLAIIFFELLSFLCRLIQWQTSSVWIYGLVFSIILIAVFVLSLWDFKIGLFFALVELIIGSQGHLFFLRLDAFQISIRIGIFIVLSLACLVKMIKEKKIVWPSKKILFWYVVLFLFIIWGVIFALIKGYSWKNILLDVNGWFYFVYLIIFLQGKINFEKFLPVFSAGVLAISLKTLFLFYYFSHSLPFAGIVYKWVRDTGIGEITLLSGNFFRIFFQSHIYLMIGFFVFFVYFVLARKELSKKQKISLMVIASLCLSGVLLSLSRSNWLGLLAGGVFLLCVLYIKFKFSIKKYFQCLGWLGLTGLISLLIIIVVLYFPVPMVWNIDATDMLAQRISADESAVSSRWSQLPNVTRKIVDHPVVGSGWGTQVTYISQDPRILQENPDGQYTTYAFEWGYLDIILKIGLAGLLVYLMLITRIAQQGWQLLKNKINVQFKAIVVGLMAGLVAILITNVFSPYLNHPLGIGYLIILAVLFENQVVIKN